MVEGCRPSRAAISPTGCGPRRGGRGCVAGRGRAGGRSGPRGASEVQSFGKVGNSHFAIEPTRVLPEKAKQAGRQAEVDDTLLRAVMLPMFEEEPTWWVLLDF